MTALKSVLPAACLLLATASAATNASQAYISPEQACVESVARTSGSYRECLSRGAREGLSVDETIELFARCDIEHSNTVNRECGTPAINNAAPQREGMSATQVAQWLGAYEGRLTRNETNAFRKEWGGSFDGFCAATCNAVRSGSANADNWPHNTNIAACRIFNPDFCSAGDVPQIPTTEFEWRGKFKVDSMSVETDLVIRGKWQDDYFDIYMAQGKPGTDVWVENLLYQGRLYSVTHEWPEAGKTPPEGCFLSQGFDYDTLETRDITVHDLNGILQSSRLVGTERIKGRLLNHFRTTCLSKIRPLVLPLLEFPLNIFSDIYVPPGRSYPWYSWLQYGDGVGLDHQQDEWFFFNRYRQRTQPIVLPYACENPIPVTHTVLQGPCDNLEHLVD